MIKIPNCVLFKTKRKNSKLFEFKIRGNRDISLVRSYLKKSYS